MAAHPSDVSFASFLEQVREPGSPLISPAKFADKLEYEQQALAELARVHRNTVRRMPKSPQLQRYLHDAIRVIHAATDLRGDANVALFWFRSYPIPEFDYQTADKVVSQGRADDVIRYIDSLDAGAAG